MAVEQNSDFLNKVADDWFDEPGDARRAWEVIARCMDEGRDLPGWVRHYLSDVARHLMGFDRETGDSDTLADAMGFFKERDEPPSRDVYDTAHIFDTISMWQIEDGRSGNISELARRYCDKHMPHGVPNTVRWHYHKARKAFWAQAEAEIAFNRMIAGTD